MGCRRMNQDLLEGKVKGVQVLRIEEVREKSVKRDKIVGLYAILRVDD